MDTATTSEGRLGSRLCFTSSLVTVRVHSLGMRELYTARHVIDRSSHLVTQLCGTLRTSQVDSSCILVGSGAAPLSASSSPVSSAPSRISSVPAIRFTIN